MSSSAANLVAPSGAPAQDILISMLTQFFDTASGVVSMIALIIGSIMIILSIIILFASFKKFKAISQGQLLKEKSLWHMVTGFGHIWLEILIWIGCNMGVAGCTIAGFQYFAPFFFLAYAMMLIYCGFSMCSKNWYMIITGIMLIFSALLALNMFPSLQGNPFVAYYTQFGSLFILLLSIFAHYKTSENCSMK